VASPTDPLVVHSHLRWDGVWQRPQQIVSRLARRRPVYFVEEPILLPQEWLRPFLAVRPEEQGRVVVLQPHLAPQEEPLPRVSAPNRERAKELLGHYFDSIGLRTAIRWHYSPMALYLREVLPGHTVVYDCMDELAAFRGAPPELPALERELLREAALVFTGRRSLYLQKRALHRNCHRLDSGVDVDHFARALRPDTPVPPAVAMLPRPILGFYGVLDERLDFDTIRALAAADPQWQIVLVGPVTKISPDSLPRAANLHYPGPAAYDELPGYVKAFDVCLIPFAQSEATRFLSPTKTLEYLAAGKPVVSSPIPDVIENYGEIVWIAESPAAFVAAVRRALAGPHPDRRARGFACARANTWDRVAEAVEARLAEVVRRR